MSNTKGQALRTFDFQKLGRSNYNEWKRQMKWLLLGEDLWGYVDGSEVKPGDGAADDGVRKWRKGNQKALYFIGTSIESELQVHIDNIENAKEAWDIIKNQFQRVSLMQKIRLRKQYYQLEFQYGGDIHMHVRKLCELHNEMKELGEPIDDKELAMTLLASLPFERYQSLIVALDVAGEDNLSFNNVKALLLNEAGANVIFSKGVCKISANGKILGIGQKYERLFGIKVVFPDHVCIAQAKPLDDYSLELWHERMGHINKNSISTLQKVVEGISTIKKVNHCLSCAKGKQQREPFESRSSHSEDILDIVHTDVMGPFEIESIGGSHYICTFIDDKSRYAFVYMIKSKKEVFEKFVNFVKMMKIQTGRSIKKVRSDNGGEYSSVAMKEFCKKKGIQHQYTTSYTPEQNGVAERFNRTIAENMRAMLYHAKLPKKFWAEAINTAVYLKNRSPHSYLDGITPFEIFHGQKPNLSNLRVFGCLTTVHIPKQQRLKIDAKAEVKIFIGYPDNVKGYRLIDPESLKVTISRNVIFHEDKFLCDIENTGNNQLVTTSNYFDINCCNADDDDDDNDDDNDDDDGGGENTMVNVNENSNVQMSRDVSEETVDLEDVSGLSQEEDSVHVGATYEETFMNQIKSLPEKRPSALRPINDMSAEHCKLAESLISEINEPSSIEEAWQNQYGKQWMAATDSEFESLIEANTWELVPLPKNKNIVGCKWIFKVKRKADNSIDRFKARLVAQGYSQKYGIDFDEVFSPVARFATIRTVLALSTLLDLDVHQLDVKTAFLNGSLDDEIYMQQPDGYINKKHPDYVCKLKRSIYGLRQAARCWNKVIDGYLKSKNYKASSADSCVYIKQENGSFIILCLYVDDILIASNNMSMLEKEKSELGKRFSVTDQGEVHYILGMAIKRDRPKGTMFLSQHNYVENVLKRFRMESCNSVTTPLAAGVKLSKATETENSVNCNLYQQVIGCLTYLMTATRPDLSAAVNLLSQFMSNPNKEHWSSVKHILRYLRGTTEHGLCYTRNSGNIILTGYSDSSWGDCIDTRRSTSGHVFLLGGNLITWRTKKQSTVAKSSTEAELVALSQATQECLWLRQLLKDLEFTQKGASVIFEDNQGAINLTKHQKHHDRTKHIAIHDLFCRERVHSGEIDVCYCNTNKMLADIMTKSVSRLQFQKMCFLLGIKNNNQ